MPSLLDAPQAMPECTRVGQAPLPRVQVPHVSVVIVNYCQWQNTAQLVDQLCDSPHTRADRVEVVVVDNNSPPSQVTRSLRRRAGVSLRRWGRNRGFARAVNEGTRLSEGHWVLLLNPDVTVNDTFLDGVVRLCQEMDGEPRAGIVGFQLHNGDGSQQLSWGPFPTLAGTLLRMLLPRRQRKYSTITPTQRCRVPWVTGCCLLVRRECLAELAGFDDRFFLYYEDVDLCRRAQERGWQVLFEPQLRVVHHHPLHSRKVPPILRLITRHSLLTYAQRHWPRWQATLLAGLIRAEASLRATWSRLRGDKRSAQLFADLATLTAACQRGDTSTAQTTLTRVLHEHSLDLATYAAASA